MARKFEHLGKMYPGKIDANRRILAIDVTFPKIICLCGSTKFTAVFNQVNRDLTLAGYIVLSVGCHVHSDEELGVTAGQKAALDELHKRKIDLADAVLVLNVDHYIGASTKGEVEYASRIGKRVGYLWAEMTQPQKQLGQLVAELFK